jgi:hypothetical protein
LGILCFIGVVNNFAANNMVILDEIKEINLFASRIVEFSMIVCE